MVWLILTPFLAAMYPGTILGTWLGWRIVSKRRADPWWPPEPFSWRLFACPWTYWDWYDRNVRRG